MQTKEKTVGDDVVQVKLTVRELALIKKALARVEIPWSELPDNGEELLEQVYGKVTNRLEAHFAKYHA